LSKGKKSRKRQPLDYVQKQRKLKADALLAPYFYDWQGRSLYLRFARIDYYQIELTGPERDLHSGVLAALCRNPDDLTELSQAA